MFNKLRQRAPVDMYIDASDKKSFKCRISLLGTVLSGKSTIASGIVLTCEIMSALLKNFYGYVLPHSTSLVVDSNKLHKGLFPKKTDPYNPKPYESGLVICERGWKEKKVHIPLCDVAGEVSDAIDPYNPGMSPLLERARGINREVINHVRDSSGFIIALPAPEALMFKEATSKTDVDAYTYHVLSQVIEYKKRSRSPKIRHIFIVLTKWDAVMDVAKDIGMDVYDPDQRGLHRFMLNGYPALSMLLKPLVEQGKVTFYRSYFKVRKNPDGSVMKHPDTGGEMIQTFEDPNAEIRWRPKYSEQDYVKLVHDIGSLAK